MAWHRPNQVSKRLDELPGVGPALATALVASVADPKAFRSGSDFSAWIGLVPKQHSSGGRERLGGISKQGDRYLRSLFVAGALAVIRYARVRGSNIGPGSPHFWRASQPRSLRSRSPTRSRAVCCTCSQPVLADFVAKVRDERNKASSAR
jgi:transposase